MRKGLIGRLLFLAGAAVLVLTMVEVSSYAGKPEPDKVMLKAKNGDVPFNHTKHAKDLKIECKTCHHNMGKTPEKMACQDCHKPEKGEVASLKEAGHGSCLKCHKEKQGSAAPVACKDCHKK